MPKLIYLALFVLASCQSVNSQETPKTETKKATAVSSPQIQKAKQIKPSPTAFGELGATYPFDIEVKDANTKSFNTKDVFEVNDKPTVLLFWLTTCYPCRKEMKAINGKYEQWQSETDFNFYAISTDWPKNEAQFIKMVKENDWPWKTYWDFGKAFRNIMPGKLNGLPQVFLLDKNGKIVYHKRKYTTGSEDVLYENIKKYASK